MLCCFLFTCTWFLWIDSVFRPLLCVMVDIIFGLFWPPLGLSGPAWDPDRAMVPGIFLRIFMNEHWHSFERFGFFFLTFILKIYLLCVNFRDGSLWGSLSSQVSPLVSEGNRITSLGERTNDGMQTGWAIRLNRSGSLQGEEILWSSCRWVTTRGDAGRNCTAGPRRENYGSFYCWDRAENVQFLLNEPVAWMAEPKQVNEGSLGGAFCTRLEHTRKFWPLEAFSEWPCWRSVCSREVVQRLQQVWNLFEISWKVGRFASCKIVVHWAKRFEPTVNTRIDRGNL